MNPNFHPRRRAAGTLAAAIALTLAGCAVGPDFKAPDAPKVENEQSPYTPTPLPAQTASAPGIGGAAQTFVAERDIPALWWQAFRSEPLDALDRKSVV